MVTNKLVWVLLLAAGAVQAREAATPAACQAAASQPAIAGARAAAERDPQDLRAAFKLSDAWSDAGCFNESVQVLQRAQPRHPGNSELEMRLRVARSLVGEESYFDKLAKADDAAAFKRDSFRCRTLIDLDACNAAVRFRPDDASLLMAQGDALMRARRPAEALDRYRRAASFEPGRGELAPRIKVADAELQSLVARTLEPRSADPPPAEVRSRARPRPVHVARAARPHAARRHVDAAVVRRRPESTAAPMRVEVAAVHPYSNAEPVAQSH